MASARTLVILIGFILSASAGYDGRGNSSCFLNYDSSTSLGVDCQCDDGKDVFGERPGWLLDCINGIVELYSKYCVTTYNTTTQEILVGGMCPFILLQREENVMINPNLDYAGITAESCGLANRTGTLCGKCVDGFSVAITDPWSFRCIDNDDCKPVNCFLYLHAR